MHWKVATLPHRGPSHHEETVCAAPSKPVWPFQTCCHQNKFWWLNKTKPSTHVPLLIWVMGAAVLSRDLLQLLCGNIEVFPSPTIDGISPACTGSVPERHSQNTFPRGCPGGVPIRCPNHLHCLLLMWSLCVVRCPELVEVRAGM